MTPMTEIEKLKDGVYEKVMSRRFAEVLKEALAEDQVRAEISADISPVYAPLSSKCMFWAPIRILLVFVIFNAVSSAVNGGNIITSRSDASN